jgi:hypothetical protein
MAGKPLLRRYAPLLLLIVTGEQRPQSAGDAAKLLGIERVVQ